MARTRGEADSQNATNLLVVKIKGIRIPNYDKVNETEIKISQLADDTTLFVNSIQSGNEAMKEVTAFGVCWP